MAVDGGGFRSLASVGIVRECGIDSIYVIGGTQQISVEVIVVFIVHGAVVGNEGLEPLMFIIVSEQLHAVGQLGALMVRIGRIRQLEWIRLSICWRS